jgi:hypothetical protein
MKRQKPRKQAVAESEDGYVIRPLSMIQEFTGCCSLPLPATAALRENGCEQVGNRSRRVSLRDIFSHSYYS